MAKELGKSKVIVDVGSNTIKVVEVTYSGKKIKINKAYSIKDSGKFSKNNELTNLSGLADVLIRSFKENNIKNKKISIIFTSNSVLYKVDTGNYFSSQKDAKSYAESQIQTFVSADKVDSMHLTHASDWTIFGNVTEDDKIYTSLYVTTIPKSIISHLSMEFAKRKYQLVEVDTYCTCLYYLSTLYDFEYENPTKAFIDIGHNMTRVNITHKGVTVFYRESNGGMKHILRDISGGCGIPSDKIESFVRRIGLHSNYFSPEVEGILDRVGITDEDYAEGVENAYFNMLSELDKCFETCKMNFSAKVNSIIVTGGTPLIKGFSSKLAELTELPVEPWELMSSIAGNKATIINNTDKNIDSSFAICVGLAIKEVLP